VGRERLFVIIAGWIGWLSIYYSRLIISPVLPYIEAEFAITHAEAGLLMTAYFIPYALAQIPGGKLSDRYGPRYVLATSMLIIAISTALLGLAKDWIEALALRILTGAGAGLYFAPLNSVIFRQFAGRERGRALGLTSSGAGMGIILTAALTGLLVNTAGWRFLLIVAATILAAIPLFLRLRPEPMRSERRGSKGGGIEWGAMKFPYTVGFVHHLVYNVFLTYVPIFLVQERHFSVAAASLTFSLIPLLMLLGHPVSGYLADYLGRRPVILASLAGCAIGTALFLVSWGELYVGSTLLIVGATLNTLYTPLNAYALDASRPGSVAANLATLNAFAYVGGAIGPYVAGLIADIYGFEASFTSMAGLMALTILPAVHLRRK